MTRVLLTAYGPYDEWKTNTSWLVLQEVLREGITEPTLTTRLYPVEFEELKQRLAVDLKEDYDYAVHMGQSPGSSKIAIEAFGINVAQQRGEHSGQAGSLASDGPPAYRTSLPVGEWESGLVADGIPARVSFHAGTYLCNAAMYWSHYYTERLSLRTASVFLHLPVATEEVACRPGDLPGLPLSTTASAVRWILNQLLTR